MATALVVLAIGVVALLLVVAAASLWRFARRLPGTARGAAEQGAASVSNRGVVSPFYYGNTPAMPPVARASSGGAAAGKPRRPITSSDSNLISFRKRSSSSSKPTSPEGQASSSGLRRRNDLRIEQVDAADSQKRSPSSGLRSSPSTGQERHHSSGDTGRSPSSATGTPPSTGLHGQSDSDKGRSSNTGQDRSPGDANTAGGRNGRAPHTVSTGSKAHAHVHSRVSVSGPPSSNKRIWVAHAQQAPVVSSRSLSESSGLQHILEVAESRYAVPEKPGAKRRDERTGGGGGETASQTASETASSDQSPSSSDAQQEEKLRRKGPFFPASQHPSQRAHRVNTRNTPPGGVYSPYASDVRPVFHDSAYIACI